jgi:predicted nucleotidyltransferase
MDFEQKRKIPKNENNYHKKNLRVVREFSRQLLIELKELVKSIVLFGSNVNNTQKIDSDIDIMIVLDNVSVFVTPELRGAYNIIVQKLNNEIGKNKIHVMTTNLSDFFDMSRKADPVLVNILRFGLPVFDRDLVEPMQYLLEIGRIKPTIESIMNYQGRAETLMEETKKHLELAIFDLYYSTVDIVHTTLMIKKIVSPSPREMPKIFEKYFRSEKEIYKFKDTIDEVYSVIKEIEHKTGKIKVNGRLYDSLYKKVSLLISKFKKYNFNKLKKKDLYFHY